MNLHCNPIASGLSAWKFQAGVLALTAALSTFASTLPPLPPMPALSKPLPPDSVPMGALTNFPEMKLDFPIAPGPFEPTWESIEKNYPGEPDWLREAKFGIWVHFGPQSAGESGDWYARNLYMPGKTAYQNHLKKYGHPSESATRKSCAIGIPANSIPPAHENIQGCRRPVPDDPRRASRQF